MYFVSLTFHSKPYNYIVKKLKKNPKSIVLFFNNNKLYYINSELNNKTNQLDT